MALEDGWIWIIGPRRSDIVAGGDDEPEETWYIDDSDEELFRLVPTYEVIETNDIMRFDPDSEEREPDTEQD